MLWCQREWDCIISMHLLLGRWSGRESCPEDILVDAQLKQRSYEQTSWGSRRPWSHLSRHKYISKHLKSTIMKYGNEKVMPEGLALKKKK